MRSNWIGGGGEGAGVEKTFERERKPMKTSTNCKIEQMNLVHSYSILNVMEPQTDE